MRNVQFAIRQLRKSPGFTAAAVVSIGVGIGGTTAMFNIIRAVLLKPLEYREPARLLVSGGITSVRFDEAKKSARSFIELGDYFGGAETIALAGNAGPEVLKSARVSANFLRILGVGPLLGRSFREEEDTPGGAAVAMISADLWRRRFGGDPGIVGRSVNLAASAYTIIGVLPPGFQFPAADIDVWVTKPADVMNKTSPFLAAFGRLKPGIGLEQANAEWMVLKKQYATAHPGMLDGKMDRIDRMTPMKEKLVANVQSMLWMLFGAVAFVLLIACANVGSLLLSRAAFRSREFAVRSALGAARRRIIVQLLTESTVLAFAGGVFGLIFAFASLRAVASLTALRLPRTGDIHVDSSVLAFAVALSALTGLLFGLAPALASSRPDPMRTLRGSDERRPARLTATGFLVIAQVGLSVILLIGAALLMESINHLNHVNVGFNTDHLLTMRISLPPTRYDTRKTAAFQAELVRRVGLLPGVHGSSVMFFLPMEAYAGTPVQDAAKPILKLNQRPIAAIQNVSPAYFSTMEIPLKRGRVFTEHDTLDAPLVAIVDETLARNLWPDRADPVGQHAIIGITPKPVEIVGVVGNIHQNLENEGWAAIYRPAAQVPLSAVAFAVRTDGDPMRYATAIRAQVLAIDRDQPVSDVKTMNELKDEELGQRRLIRALLECFAGVALLLAMVGIYGVLAYSVAQRTRELGIRQAVGAQRGDILRHVLKQGLVLGLAGVAAGIGGAYALTRVMNSLLAGVSATDTATFAGAGIVFLFVALAASYLPARRATKIDPMEALRVG